MKLFLKYNLPSILWAAVIMWLCLLPSGDLPKINIPNIDKTVHVTFYIVLTILMFYGWKKQNTFPALHRNSFIKILFIAISYGVAIEIMQKLFTTTRHFELLDILADSSGAAIGSLISVKLFK